MWFYLPIPIGYSYFPSPPSFPLPSPTKQYLPFCSHLFSYNILSNTTTSFFHPPLKPITSSPSPTHHLTTTSSPSPTQHSIIHHLTTILPPSLTQHSTTTTYPTFHHSHPPNTSPLPSHPTTPLSTPPTILLPSYHKGPSVSKHMTCSPSNDDVNTNLPSPL